MIPGHTRTYILCRENPIMARRKNTTEPDWIVKTFYSRLHALSITKNKTTISLEDINQT